MVNQVKFSSPHGALIATSAIEAAKKAFSSPHGALIATA